MLLADFDQGGTAIAAQPFLLRALVSGRVRRHVPDFLLVRADQTVQVVNVKHAARLADPAVAETLAWPGPLFEARGWDHETWTGAAAVLPANLRFLAGYRRPGMPPDEVTSAVLGEARSGERLGGLRDVLGFHASEVAACSTRPSNRSPAPSNAPEPACSASSC